ncbi:NERD domain-containing protein [bacterium]|nr:NERD domain-containing protein [bacterium]
MRLIPSHYWGRRQKEVGEGQVFDLLKHINLSDNNLAIHTLNLLGDKVQGWFELDFLVISQVAIFGLEVKAGQVTCRDGVWRVHNSDGSVRYEKHKSPLVQASDALERFRNGFMKDRFGAEFARVPFVKMAVLCSNHRPDKNLLGAEMPDEYVIYKEDLCANRFKERLNFAAEQYRLQRGISNSKRLKADDVTAIAAAARPEIDKTYPSRAAMDYLREQQNSLTEEQYFYCDAIEHMPRYLMDGGAGTGKTFLLAHDIQRRDLAVERVVVITPSRGLTQVIADRVDERVHCITAEAAANLEEKFDWLYVDEAQDYINEQGFSLLDSLVIGGLADGSWRFFGDFQNQKGANAIWQPEVFDLFESSASNKKMVTLKRNVRNTPQIVSWLEGVCGARVGETRAMGTGVEVEVIERAVGESLISGKITNSAIGHLQSQDVVVLYPEQLEQQLEARIKHLSNRHEVISIDGFRGLEASLVYVIGLQLLGPEALRDQAYKSVSRATNACFIEGGEELIVMLMNLKFEAEANAL